MKRIFRGRRYDTDTAKKVGYYLYGNYDDFGMIEETLYRKNTGEYFLYGHGGPMTKYGCACSDGSRGFGDKIIPLTLEQAQEWAEKHLDGDEYEKIFGAVEETGEKQSVTMSLDKGTIERLKRVSVDQGISVSELVCQMAKSL